MPIFLENRLRREAAKKGTSGRRAAAYVYGTMNNIGAMHGSKETPKGQAMEAKHEADTQTVRKAKARGSMNHPHKNLGGYLHEKKG